MKTAFFLAALIVGALFTGAAQAGGGSDVIRLTSVTMSALHRLTGLSSSRQEVSNGKKVGHDTLTCKVVAQKNKVRCSIAVVLSAGKLTGRFVQSFSASGGKGTITGGTGRYAGAKGTFTFKNLNREGSRTGVVVTLT